jgi:arylformamidase
MAVFANYDQAALELQFNSGARDPAANAARDAHAAAKDVLNQWVLANLACRRDIPYGPAPREAFDLFPAAASAPTPAVVFIHGGYWKSRDKSQFAWLAKPYLDRGVSFLSLGYPLCPAVRMSALVDAVRRGLAHIATHAADLGLDPTRIVVSGHSAGGHLTAMALVTDWDAYGNSAPAVRAGVALSGLYDLRPLQLVSHNAELRLDDTEVANLSPLNLPSRIDTPLCLTVGAAEAPEFIRQTNDLAVAWRAEGMAVTTIPAPGYAHFNILDLFATPGEALFEWTLAAALASSGGVEAAKSQRANPR